MARKKNQTRINNKGSNKKFEKDEKQTTSQNEQSKLKDGSEGEASPTDKEKAKNDPEWYSVDPNLLLTASSIPFSDVFGAPVNIVGPNGVRGVQGATIHTENAQPNVSEPGIVVVSTASFFGDSSDRSSPLNVCANALYTHVRYANSGRKNYDAADLAQYCITMADVYSFIIWARRIYNCAFMYSQRNQYIGKALLEAQGVDADNIIQNLVQFRYELNVFTNKIAAFAIPADINVFKRKVFLYGSIYTESEEGNIKDQIYMFNPSTFYRFELDSTSAGMLRSRTVESFYVGSRFNMVSFRNMMAWFLNSMWNNEDFGLMSGDILRAFEGKIIGLDYQPEEGGIIPVYDPFVLHQIKNATVNFVPVRGLTNTPSGDDVAATSYSIVKGSNVVTSYNLDVMQDVDGNLISHAGYLLPQDTKYAANAITYSKDVIISEASPNVDPAMVVESTRLISTFDYASARNANNAVYSGLTAKVVNIQAMTEIVRDVRVVVLNPDKSIRSTILQASAILYPPTDAASGKLFSEQVAAVAKCRYMPLMYVASKAEWSGTDTCFYINDTNSLLVCLADLRNYTVQSQEVIARLNNVALMSLLYVPGVAKSINTIS